MRSCVWQWTCKSGFLICCILFRPTMVHNFLNITNRFLSCQRTGATYCCMTHKEFRPELHQTLLCCWLYRVGLGFLKMAYCILPYVGAQWRTPKWHRIGNWYFKSILLQNTDNLKILAFRWRIGGLCLGLIWKNAILFSWSTVAVLGQKNLNYWQEQFHVRNYFYIEFLMPGLVYFNVFADPKWVNYWIYIIHFSLRLVL